MYRHYSVALVWMCQNGIHFRKQTCLAQYCYVVNEPFMFRLILLVTMFTVMIKAGYML